MAFKNLTIESNNPTSTSSVQEKFWVTGNKKMENPRTQLPYFSHFLITQTKHMLIKSYNYSKTKQKLKRQKNKKPNHMSSGQLYLKNKK